MVGSEKREATRACAPSRAVDIKYSSRSALRETASKWELFVVFIEILAHDALIALCVHWVKVCHC